MEVKIKRTHDITFENCVNFTKICNAFLFLTEFKFAGKTDYKTARNLIVDCMLKFRYDCTWPIIGCIRDNFKILNDASVIGHYIWEKLKVPYPNIVYKFVNAPCGKHHIDFFEAATNLMETMGMVKEDYEGLLGEWDKLMLPVFEDLNIADFIVNTSAPTFFKFCQAEKGAKRIIYNEVTN